MAYVKHGSLFDFMVSFCNINHFLILIVLFRLNTMITSYSTLHVTINSRPNNSKYSGISVANLLDTYLKLSQKQSPQIASNKNSLTKKPPFVNISFNWMT